MGEYEYEYEPQTKQPRVSITTVKARPTTEREVVRGPPTRDYGESTEGEGDDPTEEEGDEPSGDNDLEQQPEDSSESPEPARPPQTCEPCPEAALGQCPAPVRPQRLFPPRKEPKQKQAFVDRHPYLVALLEPIYADSNASEMMFACTGVVVSRDRLLTGR